MNMVVSDHGRLQKRHSWAGSPMHNTISERLSGICGSVQTGKVKMKTKIFIGSSTESMAAAEQIRNFFDDMYSCTVWYENFFESDDHFHDVLAAKAPAFDYAIFVCGADDLVIRSSSGEVKKAARDNVYFEIGLYTGILSKYRTFFFVDRQIQLPTDFLDVDSIQYENEEEIAQGCRKIKARIEEEEKVSRIQLLPSVSLAFNYYTNFLCPLEGCLQKLDHLCIDGKRWPVTSRSVKVIIPDDCTADWKEWARRYYDGLRCKELEMDTAPRNLSVKFDFCALKDSGELRIVDVPQLLNASFQAVDMIAENSALSNREYTVNMKERESANFMKALRNLLGGNPLLHQWVEMKVI